VGGRGGVGGRSGKNQQGLMEDVQAHLYEGERGGGAEAGTKRDGWSRSGSRGGSRAATKADDGQAHRAVMEVVVAAKKRSRGSEIKKKKAGKARGRVWPLPRLFRFHL